MNIFLIVLFIIVVVVVMLLILALFAKKDYGVECEVAILKPKQEVFNYLKLLKNQDNFSKWATMDLNMKKEYKGTDGTVGFISAWDSNEKNVGKGEQEIKKIADGERIDYEIRFIKPFESTASAYMITESIATNQTRVKWGFKSRMNYPMNLMLLFMNMEKMIGNDFSEGLTKLKVVVEK